MTDSTPTTACLLCGAFMRSRLVGVQDESVLAFNVVWCDACQLGRTSPQPHDLGPFYADQYYGRRHGATERLALRRRARFLNASTTVKAGGLLVDIGCGDGTFLEQAARFGWRVAGTELSPHPARARGLRVETSLSDLADLTPVQVVTMWHSLEHVRDPLELLAEVSRAMEPNGTLLIAVPDFGGLQARVAGRNWLHLDLPRHLTHFTRASLTAALRLAGFEPFKMWHQELEYDIIGWSQSLLSWVQPQAPPIFFNLLARRSTPVAFRVAALNLIAGAALSTLAAPVVPLLARLSRGSTMIVAANMVARPPHGDAH